MERRMQPRPGGDRLGQEDEEVRSAIRFAGVVTAAAVAFVLLAAWWAGSCDPAAETVACGRPYRAVLAAGAPVILAGGGVRAFLRTYRVWRARGTWWGWQGAGWFLMSLMLLVLFISAVPISGMG
ncbi:hypothetical protein [Mycolicibacter sinensis]|uniref:Transmembrane protein n=1 Tax=Mycolicibacter sinensis (strain JDM601) TaxID=875328 RepID=A0A1A2YAL9_MYCSD|nr:hypothetical protein [Mycolicibacter sinensis]OBH16170.1 hypothetical protein A5694_07480 [Mycolicibacter sinensis]OBI34116.1 hypothetical protein A5710_12350 [Mycolicibacter sinensis]